LAVPAKPVALASDVDDVAVVQQPVQDGRGDDRVAQHRHSVVGPDAELVDDEQLGRQVDPQPPIQPVVGHGPAQVLDQVVSHPQ
jgi:hypothetical protein